MIAAIRIRTFCEVCSSPGISSIPSTADSIEIAGVMTPSPINRQMPIYERKVTNARVRPGLIILTRISRSTMVPPSPLRPRLMASQAYSTMTRIISVHTIRETMP